MPGDGNGEISAAFLAQLRRRHSGPLNVIWDNVPAHRGEAMREYLRTPGLELRRVNLPGYSPDFNVDEKVWGWGREEATGNLCLGSKAAVQEMVNSFLTGLDSRARGGNAALPDRSPIQGTGTLARPLLRFSTHGRFASSLGLSLGVEL